MKSIVLIIFFELFALVLLLAQTVDSSMQLSAYDSLPGAQKADSIREVDIVDYLVEWFKVKDSQKKRDNRKIRFTLFPTTTASGKTSFTSFNASFLLGGDASTTNRSTIYFYPYIGFGGQYGFDIQSYVWYPQNKWNFIGEYFIHNYPQNTWGLGGSAPEDNETLVDYDHLRIHQKSMKEIWPYFSAGIGYGLDYHYNISVDQDDMDTLGSLGSDYLQKSVSSGLLLPLLYDSRHNSANPKQGFMAALTFRLNTTYLGSTEKWQSMFLDVRKYFPIFQNRKDNILAVRGYYWTVLSGNVPYLDLPSVRWEPTPGQASRGIPQNRYKSNALIDLETEYRFGITDNGFIGGVVFVSVTSASEYNTQQFMYWHPAGGVGVRMKFNKYSDTNIAFDVALSKGFLNVYLFIGEAY
jgi:hypothetical protein